MHIRAVDSNTQAPGMGHLDFVSILRTLKEMGYNRYLSIEAYPTQLDSMVIAETGIKFLKSALANVEFQTKLNINSR